MGSLTGVVLNRLNSQSISGASVSNAGKSTITNAQGQFTISGIPNGFYTLTVSAAGYVGATRVVTINGGANGPIFIYLCPADAPTCETT
jgi:hypothetical protein